MGDFFKLVAGPHPHDLCLANLRSLGFGRSDFLLSSHFDPRLISSLSLCSSLLEVLFQGSIPDALGLAYGDVDGSLPID